jgi:hypothetical protein
MTVSGWGLGEWTDMAWDTGLDYVYAPVVFLDAIGQLMAPLVARNFPIPLAATDTLAATRTTTGSNAGYTGSGPNPAYASSGGLIRYTATGVLED